MRTLTLFTITAILTKGFLEQNSSCELLKIVRIENVLLGDTGSERTLGSIKSWIQKCGSKHTACARRHASGQFQGPSRILDLRSGLVKLREDLQEDYSYACLSHCVGTVSFVLYRHIYCSRFISSKLNSPKKSWSLIFYLYYKLKRECWLSDDLVGQRRYLA